MVDIQSLVNDGLLDLDAVFADTDWQELRLIARLRRVIAPGQFVDVDIVLDTAVAYGITAYCWFCKGLDYDCGPTTLSRQEAVSGGYNFAGIAARAEGMQLEAAGRLKKCISK